MAKRLHQRRLPCQIMYEIMSLASQGEGKTRIMYGANISYALLVKYLSFLEQKGFLVSQNGHGYAVTEKGRGFMADMGKLLRHFEDGEVPLL